MNQEFITAINDILKQYKRHYTVSDVKVAQEFLPENWYEMWKENLIESDEDAINVWAKIQGIYNESNRAISLLPGFFHQQIQVCFYASIGEEYKSVYSFVPFWQFLLICDNYLKIQREDLVSVIENLYALEG